MSYLIAVPDVLATAATQAEGIGSSIRAANRAALAPTSMLTAAAGDEVSVAIASLFSGQAREYQAVSAQVAAFHERFVLALTAASGAYVAAEAANVTPLQPLADNILGVINAPTNFLFGRPLIGEGAHGLPGTGQAGGAGGILWGNGGMGGSGAPGQTGGHGGPAGLIGSGGGGGIGGIGGGTGGAGGTGGWLLGNGGPGGAGGVGAGGISTGIGGIGGRAPSLFGAPGATGSAGQENVVLAASQQQALALLAATPDANFLLIGTDGTNLSKILADPGGTPNFHALMEQSVTSASTIVGHTALSNPSWTTIQTGVWSETAGVTNNIVTPWTYDTWSTVYNQLEMTYGDEVNTTVIANEDFIAEIAAAGSHPADNIEYVTHIAGDTDWIATQNLTGEQTEAAILMADPDKGNLIFSYFVGVDKVGHAYGGDSPQYTELLRNMDDILGSQTAAGGGLLGAVYDWEVANPGEEFTTLVVTDHGHTAGDPLGIGHGFQSPRETATFLIYDQAGTDVQDGYINNSWQIVSVTPTIMDQFGIAPLPYMQGAPLTDVSFDGTYVDPGAHLFTTLSADFAAQGYPDIVTQAALGSRTIVATIPSLVYLQVEGIVDAVPAFLQEPVSWIGAGIYQSFNIPAQIWVRFTGVTGNDIIPPVLNPFLPR